MIPKHISSDGLYFLIDYGEAKRKVMILIIHLFPITSKLVIIIKQKGVVRRLLIVRWLYKKSYPFKK